MAIVSLAEKVVASWPRAARIAFRRAALADPGAFATGEIWSPGDVLLRIQLFGEHWGRGAPWPPEHVQRVAPVATPTPPAIAERARVAALLGVELALRLRGD